MYYDSGRFARFIPRGATDEHNFIFCFLKQPMSFIYIQLFDCCLDGALFFYKLILVIFLIKLLHMVFYG